MTDHAIVDLLKAGGAIALALGGLIVVGLMAAGWVLVRRTRDL